MNSQTIDLIAFLNYKADYNTHNRQNPQKIRGIHQRDQSPSFILSPIERVMLVRILKINDTVLPAIREMQKQQRNGNTFK